MATTIVWLSELATYFSCNSSIQQCMIWLHTSLSTWLCLHHVINWYLWPKDLMLPHISSYIRDAAVVYFDRIWAGDSVYTSRVWKAEQISAVKISHPPSFILLLCWVQTAQNTSRSTEESVIRNFRMIMQYFAKQILWFYLPDLHQRKWMRCLFILIYIFSDLRFLESTFFLSLCLLPSHSLPLPLSLFPSLPLSLPLSPDKASWAFCCIILTLAVFLKGGEKKKKKMYYPRTGNWFWSFALKT